MRDIEENILNSMEHDINVLRRAGKTCKEIADYISIMEHYSNDNTKEYIDKLEELLNKLCEIK